MFEPGPFCSATESDLKRGERWHFESCRDGGPRAAGFWGVMGYPHWAGDGR
jgi:hypothetical protein